MPRYRVLIVGLTPILHKQRPPTGAEVSGAAVSEAVGHIAIHAKIVKRRESSSKKLSQVFNDFLNGGAVG